MSQERKAAVLRPTSLPSNDRGGGARTTPLVSKRIGSGSMINGITYFDPGAAIGMHMHNCEESVMVLEGIARVEVGDEAFDLEAEDTTWIPPDVPHRFINLSPDKPMKIFWTYANVDATRTMIATGETRPIDAEHKI